MAGVDGGRGEYAGRGQPTEPERRRLGHLAERLDPMTRRCLKDLGVAAGWRCLEIGAGNGSMSRWLSEQVGPDGSVVAADIDPRFLDHLDAPNVEVRRLDLREDPLEPDHYDLAYCRTLLLHLPDTRAVLRKLVDALRPGGWLLVQEPDAGSAAATNLDDPRAARFADLIHRAYRWTRDKGVFDPYFGRRLPGLLDGLHLVDVGNECRAEIVRGGSAETAIYTETLSAMMPMLVAGGALDVRERDLLLGLYQDPEFELITEIQVAAWGRKPA